MLAAVVHGPGDLRVEEVPDPRCGPDQVLVAMEWGGVCGSDLAYVRHGVSGTAVLRDPLVLGHEVAGHVAEVGQRVRGVEVGARVTVHPATMVGDHRVPEELAARTNLWPQVRYFGSAAFQPHEQGGFCSLRAVRPDQLRLLPEEVSTREGALAEPLAVALHAVSRAGDVSGRSVLVNGTGPIGALCVAAARAAGAGRVLAADLSDVALDIALRMGADDVVRVGQGESLPAHEVGIEASGAPEAIGPMLTAVRRGGVVVQVGNLPVGEVSAALGQLVTREIDYRGSYRFVEEISDAVDLMAGRVDVTPLMTHTYRLADAVEAFAVAADRSVGSGKVMLQLS